MSGVLDKANLADRMDAILRSDRQARVLSDRRRQGATVLLTLVPNVGQVIDLADGYIQTIADTAGLEYIRQVGADLPDELSRWLPSTFLLVADLTGGDPKVADNVREALRTGRRVLLAVQNTADLPADLAAVPHVPYSLAPGGADRLVAAVRAIACAHVGEFVPLV
jgi:hypothetical protein